jgi:hypothetical protein
VVVIRQNLRRRGVAQYLVKTNAQSPGKWATRLSQVSGTRSCLQCVVSVMGLTSLPCAAHRG